MLIDATQTITSLRVAVTAIFTILTFDVLLMLADGKLDQSIRSQHYRNLDSAGYLFFRSGNRGKIIGIFMVISFLILGAGEDVRSLIADSSRDAIPWLTTGTSILIVLSIQSVLRNAYEITSRF